MVQIVRLVTRAERKKRLAAAALRDHIRAFLADPEEELTAPRRRVALRFVEVLDAQANPDTSEGKWHGGFSMLSRKATQLVWERIKNLPSEERPVQVRDAFMALMLNLQQDTGACELTREEIADMVGCAPGNISRIMSTLERMGVVRRERVKVDGLRGRGVVTYIVNPEVAWNGHLSGRQAAIDASPTPPLLKLMKGGID